MSIGRSSMRWPLAAGALVLILALVAGAFVATQPAAAAPKKNPVYPPQAHPHGMTYGEWGAEWWIWMGQFQVDDSPITDADGSRGGAAYQPSGSVWYLAGTFFDEAVERTVDIPPGKSLLFPIINWDVWSPEDCWWIGASEEPNACSAESLQTFLDDFFTNHVTDMSATLDGYSIPDLYDYRATSGAFTYDIEADSLWTDFGYETGPRYPNMSDGYYLMLKPLTPGEHVLSFTADVDEATMIDVTYNLNVVPGL